MAIYEYYCPTCKESFDRRRPMSQATVEVTCASGHRAERTITAFTLARGGATDDTAPAMGGGCACGGNCSCGSSLN